MDRLVYCICLNNIRIANSHHILNPVFLKIHFSKLYNPLTPKLSSEESVGMKLSMDTILIKRILQKRRKID